ncbi:hypothetical protein PsorP6_008652 [Peronosclerospora sorghi]|uniref:Uncharacterized protein n=1 Tax=Peronosclerospora sorghi TaxID=230839 RepID=A0ACC0WBT2_9STRA|nr:hypothetical protein PsorP6_008652 [Peronosclerospora sorghi]
MMPHPTWLLGPLLATAFEVKQWTHSRTPDMRQFVDLGQNIDIDRADGLSWVLCNTDGVVLAAAVEVEADPEAVQAELSSYPAPLESLVCSQEATTSTSTPADSGDNRQQATSYLETLARKKRNQAAQTGPVDELQIYLSETVIHTSENPLKYWEYNQSRFPRLSRMERDYLAVQSSSVPTEQTFSQSGDVITNKRNRLDPSTVQAVECAASWSEAGILFRSKRREDILELAAHVNPDEAESSDLEFLEDDENNGEDDFDDII